MSRVSGEKASASKRAVEGESLTRSESTERINGRHEGGARYSASSKLSITWPGKRRYASRVISGRLDVMIRCDTLCPRIEMTNRGGRVLAIEKSFVYLSYSTASKLCLQSSIHVDLSWTDIERLEKLLFKIYI